MILRYNEFVNEQNNVPKVNNRKMTQDDWDEREEQDAFDREANR